MATSPRRWPTRARRRRARRPRAARRLRRSSERARLEEPAPAMTGTDMRKLNRAAASRSRPRNRPVAIVMPERLMPGNRARAWATPMTPRLARHRLEARGRVPQRSASQSSAAPTASEHRDQAICSRNVGVEEVARSAAPRTAAGTTEMTSSQAIRRSGSSPIRRSRSEASRAARNRHQVAPEVDRAGPPACPCGASRRTPRSRRTGRSSRGTWARGSDGPMTRSAGTRSGPGPARGPPHG